MDIKTQLSDKDFINLNFLLLYRRFFMRLLTVIGIISLLTALLAKLTAQDFPVSSQVTLGVVALIVLPALTYFTAKRNYSSNKRISEKIEYVFNNEYLEIIGESFKSQLS